MKKIFYSMMAVALCSCAQSEVDEVVTAPQPENNGVTFTVVDNGFVDEDGTRVTYGDGVSYHATFEEGDQIGVYGITAMGEDNAPTAYKFENKPLTLTNGVWKSSESLDLTDVKLLFAYAPYRQNASTDPNADYKLTFTGSEGSWEVDTNNNRFFVGGNTYSVTDNGTKESFEAADWMGAAANVTAGQTDFTFTMKHMRGMVELTTHIDVVLEDMMLEVAGVEAWRYHFTPYHIETADKHVYRILTTEYRSKNTLYATIQDLNITKKYKKAFSDNSVGAGKCVRVNIDYTPAETITIGEGGYTSLDAALTEKYGANYATAPDPAFTSLRLAGTLSDADFTTLSSLTTLQSLDMFNLTNTELPGSWLMKDDTNKPASKTLTTLVLPNGLKIINGNALQTGAQLANIELPASVEEIKDGAFYYAGGSVRIPADSKLVKIGNGVFVGVTDVYTDNAGVLKIPASVTNIGYAAFASVNGLQKVIFQSDTAPAIDNGGYGNAFQNNALIYVPKREGYEGKFPEKTVIVGPILTADNYASPYTVTYDGQGLPALCDNNIDTYWHTAWQDPKSGDATYGQYIDITLPEGATMNTLMIQYGTRKQNSNAVPTIINVYTSTDGTWGDPLFTLTKEGNNLPTSNGVTYTSEKYTAASSFTKIRFAITQSALGALTTGSSSASTSLSELSIYEDMWTEPAD